MAAYELKGRERPKSTAMLLGRASYSVRVHPGQERSGTLPHVILTLAMHAELRYTDEHFEGLEPGDKPFDGAILLGCTFTDCNLGEASFRGAQLSECRFERCELAMADITDAVFQGVAFATCRLTGNDFSLLKQGAIGVVATFEGCDLSFCSFRKMDLTACSFTGCVMREAEYVQCELEGVSFADSDLERCTFHANNLIDADLRGARNYVISAHGNRIQGIRVALPEALNLLAAIGVEVQ